MLNIPSDTRLLSICTSFRRPDMLMNMLASFFETKSENTKMLVYLHEDDKHLPEYTKNLLGYEDLYMIGPHRCLRDVINHTVFDLFPDIPYYQTIVDDHLYVTHNWDSILIEEFEKRSNGWGFCCGDDKLNADWYTWSHPSGEIYSWKMASTIGYVYPKEIKHRGLDLYTKDLSQAIDGLVFVPEVIIKHLHGIGNLKPDQNLIETYSEEAAKQAYEGFGSWRQNSKQKAIDLINSARESEAK